MAYSKYQTNLDNFDRIVEGVQKKLSIKKRVKELLITFPTLINTNIESEDYGKIDYNLAIELYEVEFSPVVNTCSINRSLRKIREEMGIKGRDEEGEQVNKIAFSKIGGLE